MNVLYTTCALNVSEWEHCLRILMNWMSSRENIQYEPYEVVNSSSQEVEVYVSIS